MKSNSHRYLQLERSKQSLSSLIREARVIFTIFCIPVIANELGLSSKVIIFAFFASAGYVAWAETKRYQQTKAKSSHHQITAQPASAGKDAAAETAFSLDTAFGESAPTERITNIYLGELIRDNSHTKS